MKTTLKVTPIALAAALGLMAAGCSETSKNASISFDTYTGSASYRLEGSAKTLGQPDDAVYFDSVSLVMPLTLGGADAAVLRDTIQSFALDVKGRPVRASIDEWLQTTAGKQGFKAVPLTDNVTAGADVAQGFDIVSGFIVNLTPEMLVYCVRSDVYQPGAAHGLTTRRYINYLMENPGRVLTLNFLFTKEGMHALPERIAEQAQAMSDIIGATSVSSLPAEGNFYISSEGEIVFSYQPYEIASFSQGTVDIPFFPYELVDYMTPEAIALFHLEDLNE